MSAWSESLVARIIINRQELFEADGRERIIVGRTPAQALREALAIEELPAFVPAEEEVTLPAA